MPIVSYLRGPLPIAVILLSHADSPISGNDPRLPTRKTFLEYVSPSGRGGLFDYYRDVSRGSIDLSGSEVFGWWKMKYSLAKDFGPLNDGETFMIEAERLAKENGVDLTHFRGGLLIFTDGNGAGGTRIGRKACPFHIGGPWWGPQAQWKVCNKCKMVTYTGFPNKGKCPEGGDHTHFGGISDYSYLMFTDNWLAVTGHQGYRACTKCLGLFNKDNGDLPCPSGEKHDPSGSWNYQVMEVAQRISAASEDTFRKCTKCACLIFGDSFLAQKTDANGNPITDINGDPVMERILNGTFGTCIINSGGRFGTRHLLDEKNYALTRWWNEFHTMLIAHEVGHTFGMSESWRAKKPPEYPTDETYGDYYDVMSSMRVAKFDQIDGAYFKIAPPGLCAASMLKLGWLSKDSVVVYDFGGVQSLSPGEQRSHTVYSLSEHQPNSIGALPLNQDDAYYGASGTRAIQINSSNHVYTVEFRTKTGWDRGFADDMVLIHETRSDFISGVRGWTQCTRCFTLWNASSLACAGGDVHDVSSSREYRISLDAEGAAGNQNGWRRCQACSGLYHNGGEGFCPGNSDGIHSEVGSYRLELNNPQAPGPPSWRWCYKCQSLFYGESSLGNVAGACAAGGHHNATGSGTYSIRESDSFSFLSEVGWKHCSKCHTLVFTKYGACVAGGPHAKAAVNPQADFSLKRLVRGVSEELDPMYETGWTQCIKCYQLFYRGFGQNGVCPSTIDGPTHKIDRSSAEYALVRGQEHGDPNNKLYSDRGRRCERCLVLVFADGGGNVGGSCAAGGEHGVQQSPVYNVVNFYRDFTYIVGRDKDPAQGNRIFEFFAGDWFVDSTIGLRIGVGEMDARKGSVTVDVKRL